MPAKLNVNREAIRTLVIAHGVREAARLSGLPEGTVQAWSARFKWLKHLQPTMQPIRNQSPADALANTLADYKQRSQSALARWSAEAAEHAQRKAIKPKTVRDVEGIAKVRASVWPEAQQAATITLNVLNVGGSTGLDVSE